MSLLGKEVRINNEVEDGFLEQFIGHIGIVTNENETDGINFYTVSFKDDEEIFTLDELEVMGGGF